MTVLGLGLAVCSSAAIGASYAIQHSVASALPPLQIRQPIHSLRLLFTNGRWTAGLLVGLGGWALYVAAVRFAPLSLAQAASAGGVAVLALGADELTPSEQVGVVASLVGLVLLGLSLGSHTTSSQASLTAVATWVAVSALAAGGAAGLATAGSLGTAAGLLYAAGDVATKAAAFGGVGLVFVPVLLGCAGLAFVCLQLAFQRGGALTTAGVAVLWTNALPIAAGSILFSEGVPSDRRLAAFALVLVGVVALARRGAAAPAEATPEPAPATGPSSGHLHTSRTGVGRVQPTARG